MKMNLTKTAIKELAKPEKGRLTVFDASVPGFCIRITCNDARVFYACRWNGRQMKWARLGVFPEMTVDDARSLAREKNAQILDGEDPNAEKRANREAADVGDLWEAYKAEQLPDKKPGTATEYERLYDAHIAAWKDRPAKSITSEDCEVLKTRVGREHGKYTANRTLAVISGMFSSMGHRFGLAKRWTPTAGVEKFPEQERDRVLSPEELSKVMAAIKAEDNETIRDYFHMLLYTGARKSNVAEMSWQNISEQRGTWTIPGEQFKNGSPLVVTLVPEALAILHRRHKTNPSDSPFVFPARFVTQAAVDQAKAHRASGLSTYETAKLMGISQTTVCTITAEGYKLQPPTCFDGAGVAWTRIKERASITERTTIHDLRRTFCTNLIEAGVALPHVSAAVGHRSMETTQKHYAIARQAQVADAHRIGVASMLAGVVKADKARKAEEKKRKAG